MNTGQEQLNETGLASLNWIVTRRRKIHLCHTSYKTIGAATAAAAGAAERQLRINYECCTDLINAIIADREWFVLIAFSVSRTHN